MPFGIGFCLHIKNFFFIKLSVCVSFSVSNHFHHSIAYIVSIQNWIVTISRYQNYEVDDSLFIVVSTSPRWHWNRFSLSFTPHHTIPCHRAIQQFTAFNNITENEMVEKNKKSWPLWSIEIILHALKWIFTVHLLPLPVKNKMKQNKSIKCQKKF